MTDTIQLTDIIAPSFYDIHWDVIDGKHTYYDVSGGRGSTKSSFISVEIVLGMMQDAKDGVFSNAVVFRKVGFQSTLPQGERRFLPSISFRKR